MNEAVWLLDFDGVINARRPPWDSPLGRRHIYSAATGETYKAKWALDLVRVIRSIRMMGVDVRWCSSWCMDTEALEAALSMPKLPIALTDRPLPTSTVELSRLKLAAAEDVATSGKRLIWTDDEAVPTSGPEYDRLTANGRGLLIRPDARRGLTPDHLGDIFTFAS